jgi:hypothetical protein
VGTDRYVALPEFPRDDADAFFLLWVFDPKKILRQQFTKAAMHLFVRIVASYGWHKRMSAFVPFQIEICQQLLALGIRDLSSERQPHRSSMISYRNRRGEANHSHPAAVGRSPSSVFR